MQDSRKNRRCGIRKKVKEAAMVEKQNPKKNQIAMSKP